MKALLIKLFSKKLLSSILIAIAEHMSKQSENTIDDEAVELLKKGTSIYRW